MRHASLACRVGTSRQAAYIKSMSPTKPSYQGLPRVSWGRAQPANDWPDPGLLQTQSARNAPSRHGTDTMADLESVSSGRLGVRTRDRAVPVTTDMRAAKTSTSNNMGLTGWDK